MARPKKNTVDYFPHQCKHGKTIFILQEQYGNDGYAVWFQILEQIGSAENHVLDVRNPVDLQFLAAVTHVSVGKFREIADTLALLRAIDPDLWENGIIYSQNFVDGISDLYRKRNTEPPTKDMIFELMAVKTPLMAEETPVFSVDNPQSKVKENKTKNNKTNKNKEEREIKKERGSRKKSPSAKKRFKKPSLEEVTAHCQEKGYTFNPEAFHAFYESKGWKVGNAPMRSWEHACVTWQKRETSKKPVRPEVSDWE